MRDDPVVVKSHAEVVAVPKRNEKVPSKPQLRWEWNIRLLIRSVSVAVFAGVVVATLFLWQSSRMASEILSKAKHSEELGETKEQVKWLSRYVRLVPNDAESLASLALAVDSQADSREYRDVELSRSKLAIAISACGDNADFEQLRTSLRRKLIPRLLQLGSSRASEAEKQVLLLSAKEDDAAAMKWIAQSLVLQRNDSEYQVRDADQYDKTLEFWNWMASQPTGQVLQMAVEANPGDVDLAESLLSACVQHPIWFSTTNETPPPQKLVELTNQTIESLSTKKDDGQAQVVVYFYTGLTDPEKARTTLAEGVEPALARLSEYLETQAADSKRVSNSIEVVDSPADSSRLPPNYIPNWDWQIALEGSRIAGGEQTERIFERLVELATEKVEPKLREDAFLGLASLRLKKGEYLDAIEVCEAGLASIQQSSALNRTIAIANLQLGRTEEASKAIVLIEDGATNRLRQLDGTLGLGMSTTEKSAARTQIADEQWYARLLKGQLALIEKEYTKASRLLNDAYKTTMPISVESRAEAGRLLALCYSQTGQWDLAGQVFDECSLLRPSDASLSLSAVEAWTRAGATGRASSQITSIDDGSFTSALAAARITELVQSSKPASQVDKAALLNAIKTARQRLEAVPVEERASLEPWRLELLELRNSVDDDKAAVTRDQDSLSKLELIAEKYADVGEVQSQAAVDFAVFGRLEASKLAIMRLEQIAASSHSKADLANVALAKANVCVVGNDVDGALRLLEDSIKSYPEQGLQLAKTAARIAVRAARIERAYAIMASISEEELDFEAVVFLAGIAAALRNVDSTKADDLARKLDSWITRLKQSEGEDGTNWRYLAAKQLISKFATESNSTQLLDQASRYFIEIDARRPRWGLAASLGAEIASIRGSSEEAVELWRRAIRDGDNRVSTVLDLVRELNLLKRGDEAEVELQRISSLADSVVPISELAVSFALKRGDFSEALMRAEQLTTRKPEEVEGWLLRAQTAFAASVALGGDDSSKKKLRDDSWTFLEKAHAVSLGNNIAVWDARFRFKLLSQDNAGASQILDDLLQSSLPSDVRFIEAGRRYLTLKEFGLARECFENCLLLKPRSADAYLGLADLQNAIGDNNACISALRKAHQVAPANLKIRDRLALELAFSKNEKIEWQEIDSLIASNGQPATARSTLVGALIGLGKGDADRQSKAVKMLRDLAQSLSPERNDAKRLLANYFALQWSINANANRPEMATESFDSARLLYEELLNSSKPNPMDAARFVNLLLIYTAKEKENDASSTMDYLAIADRALQQLESATGSSVASLQLRIRLAKARGEDASISGIAADWVEGAGELESLGKQNIWAVTGQTLIELGYTEESISWLERVYEKDPKSYALLVAALAKEGNHKRAIDLCMTDYQASPSPGAATLIAEVAMAQSEVSLSPEASQVLNEAMKKFPESAALFEAVATVKLMQRRLPEAISLYETAEKIDPKRVRTLNNLAMALSEMPVRQQEALAKIERAVEIFGRAAELLDTMGQVQLRLGRLKEAEETLKEACDLNDDIRFRLHLAQVMLESKDLSGVKEQWARINKSTLEGLVLTTDEREVVRLLRSQFREDVQ